MARKKRKSRGDRGARTRQKGWGRWLPIAVLILAAVLIGVGGGWLLARQGNTGSTGPESRLAPVSQLPEKVRSAPPVVQEAYRFAIVNPEILGKLPCYCGCGSEGHESDLDCFIERFNPDGSIVFSYHAFGWSICVDIARDAMRLMRQGKSLAEIRAFVDGQYSKFGQPTDTEPVE